MTTPTKAMILAAGFGKRLRPYTDHCPKPLVTVAEKTLLDYNIDALSSAGVTQIVINTHYLADHIHDHVKNRNDVDIIISHEPEILETGGGMKKALPYFDNDPYFVLSGDSFWEEKSGAAPLLHRLARSWNNSAMDILMAIQPVKTMALTRGVGDYDINPDGTLLSTPDKSGAHMFTSIRLHHPRIFDGAPDGYFSYIDQMRTAENQGRLYGIIHEGLWHHISTAEDLENVRAHFENRKQGSHG